ncbi:MAG: hypothetical protein K2Q14_00400 [Gammaproteobacteria bacterium]|jgi:hypothetical protein|nr:hypothetical protein [Gammaproteobacteria bacterium]MBY0543991.1 hypothetical protein [Gammaproteobacteria bacterium]
MHEQQQNENTQTWRTHWVVKDVLSELPLAGSFFHTANMRDALHGAAKTTFMLLGSTVGMMYPVLPITKTDGVAEEMGKMLLNMVLGMTLATIMFNLLFSVLKVIHQRTCPQGDEAIHDTHEGQPLLLRV